MQRASVDAGPVQWQSLKQLKQLQTVQGSMATREALSCDISVHKEGDLYVIYCVSMRSRCHVYNGIYVIDVLTFSISHIYEIYCMYTHV